MPTPMETGPPPRAALAEPWLEGWQQAAALARGTLEWLAVGGDPQQLRSLWLTSMSQTMDRFMRSPAFLELMQYNLRLLAQSSRFTFP